MLQSFHLTTDRKTGINYVRNNVNPTVGQEVVRRRKVSGIRYFTDSGLDVKH